MKVEKHHPESETRQRILHAALRSFADCGYYGTSVREIVAAARVSKPVLYYYFADKAELFQALADRAQDEWYQLMQEAARRGGTLEEKLEEIIAALFEFAVSNRELVRLAFLTAFGASGQTPSNPHCQEKGRRGFEFLKSLVEQARNSGELETRFPLEEVTMGVYGQILSHMLVNLVAPDCQLNREAARQIVRLFMGGAVIKESPSGNGGNIRCRDRRPPESQETTRRGGKPRRRTSQSGTRTARLEVD